MELLQEIIVQWWAGADATARTAIIVFGSLLFITMVFSIIGIHTNPMRRPPNEIDFRRFAEARLAAAAKPLKTVEVQDDDQPVLADDEEDADARTERVIREVRAIRARRF